MSEILNKIEKSIAEDFDNNLAKAFVMEAGNTLLENGIKIWFSKKIIDSKVEETEFGRVYRDTYAIKFDGIDTSEHDAKIKAEAIDEIENLRIQYVDTCNMCTSLNCERCRINQFIEDLEKLKEQK